MAVDDVRFQARRELEAVGLSMESAAYLADDRPPDGWGALVTGDTLRAEMSALRAELRAELRDAIASQTRWLCGAVFVAFGLFAGLVRFG